MHPRARRSRFSPASGVIPPPGSISTPKRRARCSRASGSPILSQGVPLSIWYDWHDDGADAHEAEHHFGTVALRVPCRPRPGVRREARLPRRENADLRARRAFGSAGASPSAARTITRCCSARATNCGSRSGPPPPSRTRSGFPRATCTFDVVGHTGEPARPVSAKGDSLALTATDAPQYLIARGPNPVLAGAPTAYPLRRRPGARPRRR